MSLEIFYDIEARLYGRCGEFIQSHCMIYNKISAVKASWTEPFLPDQKNALYIATTCMIHEDSFSALEHFFLRNRNIFIAVVVCCLHVEKVTNILIFKIYTWSIRWRVIFKHQRQQQQNEPFLLECHVSDTDLAVVLLINLTYFFFSSY